MVKKIGLIACISILVIYVFFFYTYTIDFPYLDDYDACYLFLFNYLNFEDPWLFLRFHNEHTILPLRILLFLQYEIFGNLDLRLYCIVGAIASCVVAYLYYLNIPRNKLHYLSLVGIISVSFLPMAYVTNWSMSATQNLCILAFAFGTFHFLKKGTLSGTLISVVLQFLATFTTGGGFITFLVGCFMLHTHKLRTKLIWLVSSFSSVFFFFYLFFNRPHSKPSPSIDADFIPNVVLYVLYFFGSFVNGFSKFDILIFTFGTLLVGLLLYHFFTKKKMFQVTVIEGFLLYLVLNIGVASLARSHAGYLNAGAFRYQPVFLNILLCVSLLYYQKDKVEQLFTQRVQLFSICLFVLLYGSRLSLNYKEISRWQSEMNESIIGFENDDYSKVTYHDHSKEVRGKLHRFFYQAGIVNNNFDLSKFLNKQIPQSTFDAYTIKSLKPEEVKFNIESIDYNPPTEPQSIQNRILKIDGWVIDNIDKESIEDVWISVGEIPYKVTYGIKRKDVAKVFNCADCDHSGFSTEIDLKGYSEGSYKLQYFALVDENTKELVLLKESNIHIDDSSFNRSSVIEIDKSGAEKVLPNIDLLEPMFVYAVEKIGASRRPKKQSEIPIANSEEFVEISGWAIDKYARSLASEVIIFVDEIPYKAKYNLERKDVGKYLKSDKYNNSGFTLKIKTQDLGIGKHKLKVGVVKEDKSAIYMGEEFYLNIQ